MLFWEHFRRVTLIAEQVVIIINSFRRGKGSLKHKMCKLQKMLFSETDSAKSYTITLRKTQIGGTVNSLYHGYKWTLRSIIRNWWSYTYWADHTDMALSAGKDFLLYNLKKVLKSWHTRLSASLNFSYVLIYKRLTNLKVMMTAKASPSSTKAVKLCSGNAWDSIRTVTTPRGRGMKPMRRATRSLWSLSACRNN